MQRLTVCIPTLQRCLFVAFSFYIHPTVVCALQIIDSSRHDLPSQMDTSLCHVGRRFVRYRGKIHREAVFVFENDRKSTVRSLGAPPKVLVAAVGLLASACSVGPFRNDGPSIAFHFGRLPVEGRSCTMHFAPCCCALFDGDSFGTAVHRIVVVVVPLR